MTTTGTIPEFNVIIGGPDKDAVNISNITAVTTRRAHGSHRFTLWRKDEQGYPKETELRGVSFKGSTLVQEAPACRSTECSLSIGALKLVGTNKSVLPTTAHRALDLLFFYSTYHRQGVLFPDPLGLLSFRLEDVWSWRDGLPTVLGPYFADELQLGQAYPLPKGNWIARIMMKTGPTIGLIVFDVLILFPNTPDEVIQRTLQSSDIQQIL
jgi:hypothetical protein